MSDFGRMIAEGYFRGWTCDACGERYCPHPDPATVEEASFCPECLRQGVCPGCGQYGCRNVDGKPECERLMR